MSPGVMFRVAVPSLRTLTGQSSIRLRVSPFGVSPPNSVIHRSRNQSHGSVERYVYNNRQQGRLSTVHASVYISPRGKTRPKETLE